MRPKATWGDCLPSRAVADGIYSALRVFLKRGSNDREIRCKTAGADTTSKLFQTRVLI